MVVLRAIDLGCEFSEDAGASPHAAVCAVTEHGVTLALVLKLFAKALVVRRVIAGARTSGSGSVCALKRRVQSGRVFDDGVSSSVDKARGRCAGSEDSRRSSGGKASTSCEANNANH